MMVCENAGISILGENVGVCQAAPKSMPRDGRDQTSFPGSKLALIMERGERKGGSRESRGEVKRSRRKRKRETRRGGWRRGTETEGRTRIGQMVSKAAATRLQF
jgi:hypothetical protein